MKYAYALRVFFLLLLAGVSFLYGLTYSNPPEPPILTLTAIVSLIIALVIL